MTSAQSRKSRRKPSAPPTRRAIGYVRVSSVGGRSGASYHSPDVQRKAIEGACAAGSLDLIDTYVEEDWSGADETRPLFREMLRRVHDGEADFIVVWRISRFSRSWSHAAREITALTEAGKHLISADENLSTDGRGAGLLMQLLVSFADWEREALAEQFEHIKDRVIERGAHLGRVPVGYIKVRDKPRGTGDMSIPDAREILRKLGSDREPVHGSLVPDPIGAAVVHRAFVMRTERASLSEIRQMMDRDLPRADGGLWMSVQVARMLTLRTYLGEVRQEGVEISRQNGDAHEPIVPRALFDAVARATPAKIERSPAGWFPLSGRIYCAACSYTMAGGQPTHKVKTWASTGERVGRGARTDRAGDEIVLRDESIRVYRCPGRRGVGNCPEPSSMVAEAVERIVRTRAVTLEGLVGEVTDDGSPDPEIEELTTRIERLANMLTRMTGFDVEVDDLWQDRLVATQQERLRLLRERERLVAADRRSAIDLVQWSGLTDEEQFEVLRDSVHAIFVRKPRRGMTPDDRVHVVWAGDADAPALGGRTNRIPPTAFVFPERD